MFISAKKTAVINRYGKTIGKIVPIEKYSVKTKNTKSVLDRYFGALPDFSDISKNRTFRKGVNQFQYATK